MAQSRLVVFGYGSLGLAALETCVRLGVTPAAVVVPGNRQGPDVDLMLAGTREREWPLLVQPQRSRIQPFLADVRAVAPDLFLVWSYPMILPPELLSLPAQGAFNLHSGLLPGYRGGHTMNWALINGERETGVTLHHIDSGIDTGPVVDEERFAIDWRDDIVTVHEKLKVAGNVLLTRWWPSMTQGTAPATRQDESRAVYHRRRTAADGQVDWSAPNVAIYNLVRALVAPWPGAFTTLGSTRLVLRQVEPVEAVSLAAPGTVVRCDEDEVRIAAGQGDVKVLFAEIDGRHATASALRQAGMAEGGRLPSQAVESVQ